MTLFDASLQLYLLVLAFIASLAAVWGTNTFVLGNTTAGTGWPLLIVTAALVVILGVVLRQRKATSEREAAADRYPWSSRK